MVVGTCASSLSACVHICYIHVYLAQVLFVSLCLNSPKEQPSLPSSRTMSKHPWTHRHACTCFSDLDWYESWLLIICMMFIHIWRILIGSPYHGLGARSMWVSLGSDTKHSLCCKTISQWYRICSYAPAQSYYFCVISSSVQLMQYRKSVEGQN